MDAFIHQENLALLMKRLSEDHDATQHKILLKLLAEEKAKEPAPKMGKSI